MTKIYVIGAGGYIGSRLVERLGNDPSLRVYGSDAYMYGQDVDAGPRLVTPADHVAYIRDLRPDKVVYLAAFAHDPHHRLTPEQIHRNNVAWPLEVTQYCRRQGIPIQHISSLAVHSPTPGYPEAKRQLEHVLMTDGLHDGVNILRFGTLYGPGRSPESHRSHLFVNNIMLSLLRGLPVRIPAAEVWRPLTLIDDAITAIHEFLDAPAPYGEVRNVITAVTTVQDAAKQVAEQLELEPDYVLDYSDPRDYGSDWPWSSRIVNLYKLEHFSRQHGDAILARANIEFKNMTNFAGSLP